METKNHAPGLVTEAKNQTTLIAPHSSATLAGGVGGREGAQNEHPQPSSSKGRGNPHRGLHTHKLNPGWGEDPADANLSWYHRRRKWRLPTRDSAELETTV